MANYSIRTPTFASASVNVHKGFQFTYTKKKKKWNQIHKYVNNNRHNVACKKYAI